MPVKKDKNAEDGDITSAEDNHQGRDLIGIINHVFNCAVGKAKYTVATGKDINHERENELQRIHIKEHYEQQDRVQQDGDVVLHAIAAEEFVLVVPDDKQQSEADREGAKAANGRHQLGKGLGYFQRNDQQRDGKRKDRVAQPLDARHFMAAPAKLF